MFAIKKRFLRDKSGATTIEYSLIAGMISIAIIPATNVLGNNVSGAFSKVATAISATSTSPSVAPGASLEAPLAGADATTGVR